MPLIPMPITNSKEMLPFSIVKVSSNYTDILILFAEECWVVPTSTPKTVHKTICWLLLADFTLFGGCYGSTYSQRVLGGFVALEKPVSFWAGCLLILVGFLRGIDTHPRSLYFNI